MQKRHDHQVSLLKRLQEFDEATLSITDRLNYRLFRRQVEMNLAEFPFQWHLVPLDHRHGLQNENSLADSLSFATVKDYEDWITRLKSFPAYTDQTIAVMRGGIAAGMVQPQIVMRRLPAQIKKQVVEDPTASLYYKPFQSMPAEIPTVLHVRERARRPCAQHLL